jgi:hypothetical protein
MFGDYYIEKFSWKKFLHSFLAAFILAIFFFILIWVVGYFDPIGENIFLTHFNLFLVNNWFFIVGFVFVISIWDYLFGLFKKTKLRYINPFFESFSVFFGIWLISIVINGLKLFVEEGNELNLFLGFLNNLFYSQTLLLFVLILLIYYSKFFLKDNE